MEHYVDELLTVCGVSRANLLYSGGGHCYLLLPNTDTVRQRIEEWNLRFNDWLADAFGLGLYLADGYTECSADDLTNTPAEGSPYQAMFRRVSRAPDPDGESGRIPDGFPPYFPLVTGGIC